jgi:L-2,4-diaminobutyric acid acetyltransferase
MTDAFLLRAPRPSDGAAMWALVREAGTLDENSAYLYVLLADRFGDTCAVAERDGRLVAVLTGFRPPRDPSTYFVWQIGVHHDARGRGLASRLIDEVLARHPDVRFVEATVSPSNAASRALFAGLARRRGAALETLSGYGAALFPPPHEREPLLRIGPFAPPSHSLPRSPS